MLVENPKRLIYIGLVLVLLGFILPLLMVIEVIKTTFLISLIAHGASVSGLFLGFIGVMMVAKIRKYESMREGFVPPPRRPKLSLSSLFRAPSRADEIADEDRPAR